MDSEYPIWLDAIGVLLVIGATCLVDFRKLGGIALSQWKQARTLRDWWDAVTSVVAVLGVMTAVGMWTFNIPRVFYNGDVLHASLLGVVALLALWVKLRHRKKKLVQKVD